MIQSCMFLELLFFKLLYKHCAVAIVPRTHIQLFRLSIMNEMC